MSRLELTLIAAALLLPVPLVALNGYAAALPDAVERGLGSIVTLEAGDDHSGLKANGQASENGRHTRRSASARPAITRAKPRSSTDVENAPSESSKRGTAPASSDDDAGANPDHSGGTEDTGGSGSSGEAGSASSGGDASSTDSGDPRGLSLTIGGGGTVTGVSAGSGGVTVELGADSEGASSGDAATATVEVTDKEGSSSGVGISVPATGSAIP